MCEWRAGPAEGYPGDGGQKRVRKNASARRSPPSGRFTAGPIMQERPREIRESAKTQIACLC